MVCEYVGMTYFAEQESPEVEPAPARMPAVVSLVAGLIALACAYALPNSLGLVTAPFVILALVMGIVAWFDAKKTRRPVAWPVPVGLGAGMLAVALLVYNAIVSTY